MSSRDFRVEYSRPGEILKKVFLYGMSAPITLHYKYYTTHTAPFVRGMTYLARKRLQIPFFMYSDTLIDIFTV